MNKVPVVDRFPRVNLNSVLIGCQNVQASTKTLNRLPNWVDQIAAHLQQKWHQGLGNSH